MGCGPTSEAARRTSTRFGNSARAGCRVQSGQIRESDRAQIVGLGGAGQNGWVEAEPPAKPSERGEVAFSRWSNRALDSGQAQARALFWAPLSDPEQLGAAVWAT